MRLRAEPRSPGRPAMSSTAGHTRSRWSSPSCSPSPRGWWPCAPPAAWSPSVLGRYPLADALGAITDNVGVNPGLEDPFDVSDGDLRRVGSAKWTYPAVGVLP